MVLPVPDQATMQVLNLGSTIRFSWSGVDQPGTLFYRITIRDTSTGYTYSTPLLNQASADVATSSLPA